MLNDHENRGSINKSQSLDIDVRVLARRLLLNSRGSSSFHIKPQIYYPMTKDTSESHFVDKLPTSVGTEPILTSSFN